MSSFPEKLTDRFRRFKHRHFVPNADQYEELARYGQSPEVMVISCCDSRVDPETIFTAMPGEMFVVRNVANLVPPYETGGKYHGVSTAIEFAVANRLVDGYSDKKFRPDAVLKRAELADYLVMGESVRQYLPPNGLKVVKDPGVNVIWVASALMVLGLVMVFWFPHRRLWALCTPRPEGGVDVRLAAAPQRDLGMEKDFERVSANVRRALTSRQHDEQVGGGHV